MRKVLWISSESDAMNVKNLRSGKTSFHHHLRTKNSQYTYQACAESLRIRRLRISGAATIEIPNIPTAQSGIPRLTAKSTTWSRFQISRELLFIADQDRKYIRSEQKVCIKKKRRTVDVFYIDKYIRKRLRKSSVRVCAVVAFTLECCRY